MSLTIADDPGCLRVHAQVRFVYDLPALPQVLLRIAAAIVPQYPLVVGESGEELAVLQRLGATLQHGAHHGGHVLVPAVVTHRAPAAVTVDLQLAGAVV